MEEKLVTIVVLPYSKAQILKMRLEAKNIECDLEDINLIEGTTSFSVKVKIMEKDIQEALPMIEDLLGKKPVLHNEQTPEKKERHILVPVDFSPSSEKTCKMALDIARLLNVKLVFMHCFINPLIHSIPFSDIYAYDTSLLIRMENAEKNANENFQKFMTKMAEEIGSEKWNSVKSEFIIKSGYADEDILAYATQNKSDMIIMGRGQESSQQTTLGSVTADAIYNSPVPVLVIPENTPDQELSKFSRVLYATNFDEKDFVVVDKLMSLLKPFDMKLICAHVGQPKQNGWDLARLEGMKDILHEKYRDKEFECRLIVGNHILNSLEKFIKEENIDVLSLTTHKRNMISQLFNPSLARKMVFHTTTPLLVFHA